MISVQNSRRLLAICITFALFVAALSGRALAQGGNNEQTWSVPFSLYEQPTDSWDPAIAADSSGRVHVVWGESLAPSSATGNMILYRYWDGQSLSPPNDILVAPDGLESRSWKPDLAVSSDGQLHLFWIGGFGSYVYYTSARADEAMSAAAWSKPAKLGDDAGSVHVVIDENNKMHVVFTVPNGQDQGIYYLYSEDGGQSWSLPRLIPDTRVDPESDIRNGRLAVGDDGTIHVAWWWIEEFPPKGVFYIRSTDGGDTWSDLLFMEGTFQELDVATVGEQEVHLVWSSTVPERYKWYRWSKDGGRTWTPAMKWPELGGFHGWSGMAVDSDGILHLSIASSHAALREAVNNGSLIRDEALIHTQWDGNRWSELELVLLNAPLEEENMKNAAIAISEGNLVHLLVQYPLAIDEERPYHYDVYYSQRRVNSSYIAPQPLPTIEPTPSPTIATSAQPTIVPTPTPTVSLIATPIQPTVNIAIVGPGFVIMAAVAPVLIILAGIILIWFKRFRF